ncbi:MAG: hypothetical protein PHN19_02835 [Patescibacteria group bacterium]|nr:hypothetical protein [Patescibacteria group bacterium]
MQIFLDYIEWWYSYGLIRMLKYLRAFILVLTDTFSVRICLTTLFAPWKRDVVSTEGMSLQERFGVWGGNMIARMFGFVIKSITLLIFLICFSVLLCFEVSVIVIWLLLPMLLVEGIVFGIMYLR